MVATSEHGLENRLGEPNPCLSSGRRSLGLIGPAGIGVGRARETFDFDGEGVAVPGGKDVNALLSTGGIRHPLDLPALVHQVPDNEGLNRCLWQADIERRPGDGWTAGRLPYGVPVGCCWCGAL